jgi:hypothetical protein
LRINSKACCTEAVDGSEKTTPDFFSIQDFTEDMDRYFQAKKGISGVNRSQVFIIR